MSSNERTPIAIAMMGAAFAAYLAVSMPSLIPALTHRLTRTTHQRAAPPHTGAALRHVRDQDRHHRRRSPPTTSDSPA